MNIFVTSADPVECAHVLDDKRVIKMVLESAQLLSNALPDGVAPYRRTHINHPCSLWVAKSVANYAWLYAHFIALSTEYYKRFHKQHACRRLESVFYDNLSQLVSLPSAGEQFVNCTPLKSLPVFDAYRETLISKWSQDARPPKWTNCDIPVWAQLHDQNV